MQIRIHHLNFTISEPYFAGHTLDEIEARVLNSTRAEAIRSRLVQRITTGGQRGMSVSALQEIVTKEDEEFKFIRRVHRRELTKSLLEAEATALATERVLTQARSVKRALSKEELDSAVKMMLEDSEIYAEARARINARTGAAIASIDELTG
jgi:hypothetical protein